MFQFTPPPCLAIITLYLATGTSAEPFCEGSGWVPYKNEKCYKLLDSFANWQNARNLCAGEMLDGVAEAPTLASITSRLEQEFLTNYVFNTSEVTVSVWLGGSKLGNPDFVWEDGNTIAYLNWAEGFPSGVIGRDCMEMVSSLSRVDEDGQWKDTSCASGNLVLCEKLQTWSMADVQRMIIKSSHNTMPVGFIYAQLPFTQSPDIIWPTMEWTDVSDDYAGRFFRVVGGNSAAFGVSQADAFQGHEHGDAYTEFTVGTPSIASGNYWSRAIAKTITDGIATKSGYGTPRYAIETRSINYSIKIWKRHA